MPDIAIVGGGIGGVAAAAALARAGIRATVYERASRILELGAGMMLWPNATRVLRGLGLLDSALARSGSSTHFAVQSSRGRILMTLALGEFDAPAICMRRADLLAILTRAIPPDRMRLGFELDRFEENEGGVRLFFKNGAVAHHSVIIGADGIRSRVRAQLFGYCEPVYRGYVIWRGIASYSGGAILPGFNSETWGRGKRFGILKTGDSLFTWYATANVSKNHLDPPAGRRAELLRLFRGWHEPVEHLIRSTGEILKNGAFDLPPLRRWTRGRATLLGDAAHPATPNLGQGGCMALEDAAALARCLHEEARPEEALARYESLRRSRTRHIQQRSLYMGRIGQWENGAMVAGRGFVTSLLPSLPFEYNLRKVYSYET